MAAYKAEHDTPSLQILPTTDPRTTELVEVIQQMWQQVGFPCIDRSRRTSRGHLQSAGRQVPGRSLRPIRGGRSRDIGLRVAQHDDGNSGWYHWAQLSPEPRPADPVGAAGRCVLLWTRPPKWRRTGMINQRLAQASPTSGSHRTSSSWWLTVGFRASADFTLPDGTVGHKRQRRCLLSGPGWVDHLRVRPSQLHARPPGPPDHGSGSVRYPLGHRVNVASTRFSSGSRARAALSRRREGTEGIRSLRGRRRGRPIRSRPGRRRCGRRARGGGGPDLGWRRLLRRTST